MERAAASATAGTASGEMINLGNSAGTELGSRILRTAHPPTLWGSGLEQAPLPSCFLA